MPHAESITGQSGFMPHGTDLSPGLKFQIELYALYFRTRHRQWIASVKAENPCVVVNIVNLSASGNIKVQTSGHAYEGLLRLA